MKINREAIEEINREVQELEQKTRGIHAPTGYQYRALLGLLMAVISLLKYSAD